MSAKCSMKEILMRIKTYFLILAPIVCFFLNYASAQSETPFLNIKRISVNQLDNMEYSTDDGKCHLTNGTYISHSINNDTMIYREVMRGTYVSGIHAADHVDHVFGDLNNDGFQDAVVILREHTGGTGVFIYLAVVMNENGKLRNTVTTSIGDRQEITSLSINTGTIRIEGFTHRPTDGLMQPTLPAVWVFNLDEKQLKLTSGKQE